MLETGSKMQKPNILKMIRSYPLYFVFILPFHASCKISLTDANTDLRFIRKSLITLERCLLIGALPILGCQDKLTKKLLCNYPVTMAG